ncbi:MAG: dienelactone hydrolase family protein [Saonia sp.]
MKTNLLLLYSLIFLVNTAPICAQQIDKSQNNNGTVDKVNIKGKFVTIGKSNGIKHVAYMAGPESSKLGIIFVHDYFGVTEATKSSVERLGALGYQTIAVDLYNGKTADTNDSATVLMNNKNSLHTESILESAIEFLRRPHRELVSIGFSAGGMDALKANLMNPELFAGTAVVYGGNYDAIEADILNRLDSPFLAITGSDDEWALNAALNYLQLKPDKPLELYVYPSANHGYAQPLFSAGANYDEEAVRLTWLLLEDFLGRHLKS